jgi:hypothetical protein
MYRSDGVEEWVGVEKGTKPAQHQMHARRFFHSVTPTLRYSDTLFQPALEKCLK